MRVTRAKTWRHVPLRPHLSARSLSHQSTPCSLSLSPTLPKPLSLQPSHGGASLPPLPLKTYLAGAPPENDAGELHRPDLLFFLGEELPQQASSSSSSPSSSSKQGGRPRASPSLPRHLGALVGTLLIAGECTPFLIRTHCPRI